MSRPVVGREFIRATFRLLTSLGFMRALRLILAGLIAATVLVAGFFAAAVIMVTGLVANVVRLFFGKPGLSRSRPSQPSNRHPNMRTDDVIDVVATKVPADQNEIQSG